MGQKMSRNERRELAEMHLAPNPDPVPPPDINLREIDRDELEALIRSARFSANCTVSQYNRWLKRKDTEKRRLRRDMQVSFTKLRGLQSLLETIPVAPPASSSSGTPK